MPPAPAGTAALSLKGVVMAKIKELLQGRTGEIVRAGEDTTVLEATMKMNETGVGSLVVTRNDGSVAGIFTERDVLRRVVAARRDPATTKISEIMSRQVICCTGETTLDEARNIMMSRRIRHLPVIDDKQMLQGIISIGDLNAAAASRREVTIQYLEQYIHGIT